MITKTWIDKASWGEGEWQHEPDRIEWESHELPCLMLRANEHLGHWCGYVAIPPNHPYYGFSCDDVSLDAHGGVNFSDSCQAHDFSHKVVCHQPKPGDPDNVWWFGFDCCHAWDIAPGMNFKSPFAVYRNVEYVKAQVESLATQIASMK